jgi:hypothetical protein
VAQRRESRDTQASAASRPPPPGLIGQRRCPVLARLDAAQRHVDGVRRDLAAFDGAVEDGPCLVPAGLDQALPVLGG